MRSCYSCSLSFYFAFTNNCILKGNYCWWKGFYCLLYPPSSNLFFFFSLLHCPLLTLYCCSVLLSLVLLIFPLLVPLFFFPHPRRPFTPSHIIKNIYLLQPPSPHHPPATALPISKPTTTSSHTPSPVTPTPYIPITNTFSQPFYLSHIHSPGSTKPSPPYTLTISTSVP